MRRGCDDGNVVIFKKIEDILVGGDSYREVEDHSTRGADDVRIEDVDEGFADDEGVDAGSLG